MRTRPSFKPSSSSSFFAAFGRERILSYPLAAKGTLPTTFLLFPICLRASPQS